MLTPLLRKPWGKEDKSLVIYESYKLVVQQTLNTLAVNHMRINWDDFHASSKPGSMTEVNSGEPHGLTKEMFSEALTYNPRFSDE